jgi:hypothetical protein
MKKQTKKQTTAKRPAAKPKAKPKAKSVAKSTAKSKAKPKAKPAAKSTVKPKVLLKKSKPVVTTTPSPKAKPKSKLAVKPIAIVSPPTIVKPPVAESVVQSKPVAALPPPTPPVGKPEHSEMEELRRIEMTLAEVENTFAGNTGQAVTINPVSAVLINDITELLEELIDTASPKLASTISRLAYVLCEVMPGLQAVSRRADIALCRKCGVTFGWDRQAEAERAVRSGKYQKSIAIS